MGGTLSHSPDVKRSEGSSVPAAHLRSLLVRVSIPWRCLRLSLASVPSFFKLPVWTEGWWLSRNPLGHQQQAGTAEAFGLLTAATGFSVFQGAGSHC